MKFFEYLDIIYINKNVELQKQFDLKLQAETRSVSDLINAQRKWFKFIAYFQITFSYLIAKFSNQYPTRVELPQASSPDLTKTTKKVLQSVPNNPA